MAIIIISGTGAPLAGPIITLTQYITEAQDVADMINQKLETITEAQLEAATGINAANFTAFNTLIDNAVTALNNASLLNLQKNLL